MWGPGKGGTGSLRLMAAILGSERRSLLRFCLGSKADIAWRPSMSALYRLTDVWVRMLLKRDDCVCATAGAIGPPQSNTSLFVISILADPSLIMQKIITS